MKYKLLIVDDELANLRLLERLFARDFECLTASSGEEAIQILEQHDVAILLTDQRMPQMTGIDLLVHTARLRPHMVRILLTGYTDVEVLVEAINSGLVYMYVTKPWNNEDLKLKISRACQHYESNKRGNSLELATHRLGVRLHENKLTVIAALTDMLRSRDEHAYDHALRVSDYATTIAQTMGMSESDKEDLSAAAMLHDLGVLDIFSSEAPARRFTSSRPTSARPHSECEAQLLATLPELAGVADAVKHFSENFDGSGSPRALAGEQIPFSARILRVADEYDLMTQPKVPAASLRHDETMRFLSQRSGKQFDPMVIKCLSDLSSAEVSDTSFSLQDPDGPDGEGAFELVYSDALSS